MVRCEREELKILRRKGYSFADIGETMGRAASSLWQEMQIGSVRGAYDPEKAQHKAYVRRKYAKYQGMKIAQHDNLRHYVRAALFDDQSPAAIAGRIRRREKHLPTVSKNAIYRYIESPCGRRIETHRWLRKKRRRGGRRARSMQLPNRTFIDNARNT